MRPSGMQIKNHRNWLTVLIAAVIGVGCVAAKRAQESGRKSEAAPPPWEKVNPVRPLPEPPLGIEASFADLDEPPTPERVRLGRWLFYDTRLSADGTISCASCHQPECAFSERKPVSTGIHGLRGTRKAPPIINLAWTLYPHFFWDGRADSLEDQALGPVVNEVEMGNTHRGMIRTLRRIEGYAPYFKEAFGSPRITKERVAHAIADYERTLMSGNSFYDRWQAERFEDDFEDTPETRKLEKAHDLFFGKAACSRCHLGQNFTDSDFWNLGVGYDPKTKTFDDIGRYKVSGKLYDKGAFKTPTLREVTKHPPYMHDGSHKTLREVIEFYNQGGIPNPHQTGRIFPLKLTDEEIDLLVFFLESLEGEGYMDTAPEAFPQ